MEVIISRSKTSLSRVELWKLLPCLWASLPRGEGAASSDKEPLKGTHRAKAKDRRGSGHQRTEVLRVGLFTADAAFTTWLGSSGSIQMTELSPLPASSGKLENASEVR
jgi:hypothetical protein